MRARSSSESFAVEKWRGGLRANDSASSSRRPMAICFYQRIEADRLLALQGLAGILLVSDTPTASIRTNRVLVFASGGDGLQVGVRDSADAAPLQSARNNLSDFTSRIEDQHLGPA